jgi:glutamyl-tRNA reductase
LSCRSRISRHEQAQGVSAVKLALVGISHHRAPVELRERVAVELDGAAELARSLAGDKEAVVLSTCNRTEIYLAAGEDRELDVRAGEALLALAGERGDEIAPVLYRLTDESAALHLFRVAAGLDSLVPGEGEILGQVRAAYEVGTTGPLLDRVFRQALHAGRRARVETAIGESPASVPAAAAALAQQVFDDLHDRNVVLVGAGKMSELTARNLRSRGARIQAVANRTAANGTALAERLNAQPVDLDGLGEQLRDADIVVSSTSSPGFVLQAAELERHVRARRGRPLLLVDLAVPRDVDPDLAAFDGCFVYDIDDLEAVVEASLVGRRAEAARAERVVALEAERFQEWQASLAVVPAIASLRARAEEIRTAELAKAEGRLGRLSESERRLVESVTSQIVNKLLHLPTVRLKQAAAAADGLIYADVVRHLFGLEGDDGGPR